MMPSQLSPQHPEDTHRSVASEVADTNGRTDSPEDVSVPLYKPHIPDGLSESIGAVLSSGQIAGGPCLERFERMLAEYLGNPWILVNSDISAALTLCLFQAGVRPGDDVLMAPLVCLSTSCPVGNLFANVRWCDIDPMTGNIDASDVARKITPRSKALVVYHWAGNPADLDALRAVARDHEVAVVEDAGEALGAEYNGKKVGAGDSDFAVFSFYPNRHITTIDGGAISCAREADYEKLQWLRRYGIHQPSFRDAFGEINPASDIPIAGWNSYMNNVAASIGTAQMHYLPALVARHQNNGRYYDERFSGVAGVTVLRRPPHSRSSYWVYTVLTNRRDYLLAKLRQSNIRASTVHWRNDAYTCFGTGKCALPGVEYFSTHSLSIPCGWWVTDAARARIADMVCQAAERST